MIGAKVPGLEGQLNRAQSSDNQCERMNETSGTMVELQLDLTLINR